MRFLPRGPVRAVSVAACLALFGATGAAACPSPSYPAPVFAYAGADLYYGQAFSTQAAGGGPLASCGIPGARGYANDVATMTLNLSMMDGYELTVDVQSECDSTLLVNAADGSWVFDDDSGEGLMPRVAIADAWRLNGSVQVWIGTYGGGTCPATLTLRTGVAPGMPDEAGDVPMGTAGCPDPGLTGQTLAFTGDQLWARQSLPVQASGTTQLANCGIVGTRGYANPAPSYTVYLSGMSGRQLQLSADASCDSTMLVRTPDGMWHFNDDGNGNLDPLVTLAPPTALDGRVDIWVGTYGPTPCAATLNLQATGMTGGPVAPQPQQAAAILGRWSVNANGYTGWLEFTANGAGGYQGILNLGLNEEMSEISFDPASGRVQFTRPRVPQVYTGTISGGAISGTFTSSGTVYNWHANR